MDRLTAAKVFIDVAQSGSFTATADRLDMSRPMVTRYIEAMEDWLSVRLLHRTTRKVSLTTAGESCLKQVEEWLAQADKLTATTDTGDELTGTVRIATSMSFGFSQLIPVITAFMKQHPKVSIDIDLQDSVTDMADSQIDLAIRIASNPDPSLIGKPIAVCDSVIVASPSYVENVELSRPEDLSQFQCLGYKNFQRHVWHLSKGDEHKAVEVHCQLTANEATVLLHAALNGAGLAIQPRYLADEYLSSGKLVQILPEWRPQQMKVYALYSSRKHLSRTVRCLIDFFEDYLVS
ncbi:LysR family transcriptional regulator [Vibrio coralliilyticus]|uniref:LysR family transcriptional regulator n=1 Tax=Vibrio coralliilyticus TaxID=190893 RepID=UPI001560D79E|nr:LysR family transcriptional regulator [Vibrio coralliilyticus]NRF62994.1 LysR family transcriptional regulator [Vibrio coralliilyticus]